MTARKRAAIAALVVAAVFGTVLAVTSSAMIRQYQANHSVGAPFK